MTSFASFQLADHKICGVNIYGEHGSKLSQKLRFARFVRGFKDEDFFAGLLCLSGQLTN